MFHRSLGGRLRNELCASGQRMMPDSDVMGLDGLLVTTPVRTTIDLGRLLPRVPAFSGMDMMLSTALLVGEEVLEALPRFKGFRGVCQLRALAPYIDPSVAVARRVGRPAALARLRGPAAPEPQVEVEGPHGPCCLDIGDRRSRFVAEYDGQEWHGEEQAEHDEERRSFIARTQHWTIKVFRCRHVYGRHADVEDRLRAGMREALDTLGRRVGRLDAGAFATPRRAGRCPQPTRRDDQCVSLSAGSS